MYFYCWSGRFRECRTTCLTEHTFCRVHFFSFWLIFMYVTYCDARCACHQQTDLDQNNETSTNDEVANRYCYRSVLIVISLLYIRYCHIVNSHR